MKGPAVRLWRKCKQRFYHEIGGQEIARPSLRWATRSTDHIASTSFNLLLYSSAWVRMHWYSDIVFYDSTGCLEVIISRRVSSVYFCSTNSSCTQVSIISLLDFFVYNTVVGSDNPHRMNASCSIWIWNDISVNNAFISVAGLEIRHTACCRQVGQRVEQLRLITWFTLNLIIVHNGFKNKSGLFIC